MGSRRLFSLVLFDEFGSLGDKYGLQLVSRGGGTSRHSWQQRSINVIIKWCRIKRRPKEVMKTGVSPYLFVIGDDHVTRYMGVVDVVGDAGET
ncbi:hypothetical protein DEO72_LG11g2189 [Vigna unguiculata]|uniref:Uncharacterized protein n=1 Tax=Vigna unguiculata TaxID=3917 RepID=A0A4D6NMW6_VIGUN|nr:hypothetical protein DEO72_LG11g2189 [Vigna unguiculata]